MRPVHERDVIVRSFKRACKEHGLVVPMATVSLFTHPVFRDGAFTASDPEVRAYACAENDARDGSRCGTGREDFRSCGAGAKESRPMRAARAVTRSSICAKPSIILCEYNIDKKYGFKLAMEAKPNEPRGDIYMATTGHYLGFIPTLDHPEMVGVNPEFAHETMAGLNFLHNVAQAWEAGKLVSHRSERSDAGAVRSGFAIWVGERQGGVLSGEVFGRRRVRGFAAF